MSVLDELAGIEPDHTPNERPQRFAPTRRQSARKADKETEHKDPPKRSAPSPAPSLTEDAWAQLKSDLEGTYEFIATIWAISDKQCAGVLNASKGKLADAWVEKAKTNPRLEKWLRGVSGPGGWMGIIAAHVPLLTMMFTHHVVQPRQEFLREQERQANANAGNGITGTPTGYGTVHSFDPATANEDLGFS